MPLSSDASTGKQRSRNVLMIGVRALICYGPATSLAPVAYVSKPSHVCLFFLCDPQISWMDMQWNRGSLRCGASPRLNPSRNSCVPCFWGSTAPIIHHALHAFSLGRHASTRQMRPRTKKTGQCYAMPCYLGASTLKHSIDSHDAFALPWTALHHDHGHDHHHHGGNAERHRPRGYLQHPVCSFHNAIKGPAGRQRLMAGGASAVR
jgi:hypothetical protein